MRGHEDVGLQPERTTLAWHRTLASMIGISAIFLRWIPDYRWFAAYPVGFALAGAGWVLLNRRRRYQLGVAGIVEESIRPPVSEVAMLGASVAALASSGIYVLFLSP